jgi:hypothetical protein
MKERHVLAGECLPTRPSICKFLQDLKFLGPFLCHSLLEMGDFAEGYRDNSGFEPYRFIL